MRRAIPLHRLSRQQRSNLTPQGPDRRPRKHSTTIPQQSRHLDAFPTHHLCLQSPLLPQVSRPALPTAGAAGSARCRRGERCAVLEHGEESQDSAFSERSECWTHDSTDNHHDGRRKYVRPLCRAAGRFVQGIRPSQRHLYVWWTTCIGRPSHS
jgi:hypothetical protein